jgi:hypothetical protein
MRKEVLNQLKKEDFDLIQCEYLHTLNFIPNLRQFPSLLTHHEVLSLVRERSFRSSRGCGAAGFPVHQMEADVCL